MNGCSCPVYLPTLYPVCGFMLVVPVLIINKRKAELNKHKAAFDKDRSAKRMKRTHEMDVDTRDDETREED